MPRYSAPRVGLAICQVVAVLLVVTPGSLGAPAPGTAARVALAPPARVAASVNANPRPSAATACTGLEGVDVNATFGAINWAQVAHTKVFAYARVGDGAAYLDPTFLTNYAGIKAAGLTAGGYFYFEPAQDPTTQANHFVSQLVKAGLAAGDLLPMFALDTTGAQTSDVISANLQTAADVIYSTLGVWPGFATNATIWDTQFGLGGATVFAQDPLWDEIWTGACPAVPAPWSDWALWQYSDMGTVSGITGQVDLDRANTAGLPVYTGTVTLRIMLPLVVASH